MNSVGNLTYAHADTLLWHKPIFCLSQYLYLYLYLLAQIVHSRRVVCHNNSVYAYWKFERRPRNQLARYT